MQHTAESLIAFESRIRDLWEAGELPFLVHLCGGNEAQLLDVFEGVREGDWIFSTHRNHYHALLAGVAPDRLEALIREGRSMFVFDQAKRFFTSSVLAGTCCIAAGVALAIKRAGGANRVWCFLGDGAEEQGHFYEAALFAEANALPVMYVIEDNDRQVDTPKCDRRGKDRISHTQTPTPGVYERQRRNTHTPLDHFACVRRYHYTATYPHAGSGCAHKITFNPEIVKRHAEAAT